MVTHKKSATFIHTLNYNNLAAGRFKDINLTYV